MSVVLHASGFVRGTRATSVRITSYEGRLEDVVPPIVERIKSDGHSVSVWRTWPLGGGDLVSVEMDVLVINKKDKRRRSHMWHQFCYRDEPWTS